MQVIDFSNDAKSVTLEIHKVGKNHVLELPTEIFLYWLHECRMRIPMSKKLLRVLAMSQYILEGIPELKVNDKTLAILDKYAKHI